MIYGNVSSFIPDIGNLFLLSFILIQPVWWFTIFIDLFKEPFFSIDFFSICFFAISLIFPLSYRLLDLVSFAIFLVS